MRSPRSRFETACRVGAFALLGWLLGNSIIPDTARHVQQASSADVASRLVDWTRAPSSDVLHVATDVAPAPWIAEWLGALRRSGHVVTWTGAPAPYAISVSTLPDPLGGVRVDVAAPSGSVLRVSDDAGTIDSLRVAGFGATVVSPIAVGRVRVRGSDDQEAAAAIPDSAPLRSVLVVGQAGWEGKYIASALEERGWTVAARFSVAPGVEIAEDATAALDTSRFAAVIALDSTVDRMAPAIEQFVRQGGGLVLAGRAAASRKLIALSPGVPDARTRASVQATDTLGLGATGFYPVASLKPDAVLVEQRAGRAALAARRVGAGRVMQVGYDDTWRWRMAGGARSEAAHRDWWARVVASVAYVPPARAAPFDAASAPVAALVDQIGASRPAPAPTRGGVDPRILIILMMILLSSEWASRRWRGLR